MKIWLGVLYLIATGLFLTGCASQTETTQTTAPTTAVPGEKRDASEVTPGMGPQGASANVHF